MEYYPDMESALRTLALDPDSDEWEAIAESYEETGKEDALWRLIELMYYRRNFDFGDAHPSRGLENPELAELISRNGCGEAFALYDDRFLLPIVE